MADLHGPRAPRWRYTLLNRDDQPLRKLIGVTGGGVDVDATTRLRAAGNLTIEEMGQEIDWLSHRVRISYDPGIPGVSEWPVATMLLSSPKESYRGKRLVYDVGLLGKLAIIDETSVKGTYSVPAGAVVIDRVLELINDCGERRYSVSPSTAVTRSAMVWKPGTSYLTIINDLLSSIGYWSLWCDGAGVFRIEPYVDPGDRLSAFDFAAGARAVHSPDWDRDQDLSSIPNIAIVVSQGDGEQPAIVGTAWNLDPRDPFSIPNRGREIPVIDEGAEVDSQATADLLAARLLRDARSAVAHLSVQHFVVPLNPNDVVSFAPSGAAARRASVQAMRYTFTFNGWVEAEWREL
ncbi:MULTISPECIES: hypothetical protein [unclassified Leucobacter]|uniref:hypothetical protein n=1 Tax=unclassified Leucobacter TaxID=2621730 RepID=UPI000A07C42E|nr:hypothetical protein [Leucobacter sp. Ag1]